MQFTKVPVNEVTNILTPVEKRPSKRTLLSQSYREGLAEALLSHQAFLVEPEGNETRVTIRRNIRRAAEALGLTTDGDNPDLYVRTKKGIVYAFLAPGKEWMAEKLQPEELTGQKVFDDIHGYINLQFPVASTAS